MGGIIHLALGFANLVAKKAGSAGAKLAYVGGRKLALKGAPDAIKIAAQKKAEAKAAAAAKYKASLLMSHGIPAKPATIKTTAGKMAYVVTHAKPVIVKNVISAKTGAVGKVKLMLVATGKGFTVKAVPLGVTAAKATISKGAIAKAGMVALGAGGYLVGWITGAGW